MQWNQHICFFCCRSSDHFNPKQVAGLDVTVRFIFCWDFSVLCQNQSQDVRWFMTLFFFQLPKKRHWLLRSSDKLNPHLWLPFLGEPQLHRLSLQKKIYYIHCTDSLIATCWTEWHWRMTAWEQGTSHFIWRDRKMNERFDKIIKDCLSPFSAKLSFFVTWRLCFAQIFQWINILKLLFFFLFIFFFFASPWITKKPQPNSVFSADLH